MAEERQSYIGYCALVTLHWLLCNGYRALVTLHWLLSALIPLSFPCCSYLPTQLSFDECKNHAMKEEEKQAKHERKKERIPPLISVFTSGMTKNNTGKKQILMNTKSTASELN